MNDMKGIPVKLQDEVSVILCHNGYMITIQGENEGGNYCSVRYLLNSSKELKEAFELVSKIPRV